MPYDAHKPMQIRKGTIGYVVKIVNPYLDTMWRIKTYSSPQNVLSSLVRYNHRKGDIWYVYNASTLDLTHVGFIRLWEICGNTDCSLCDLNMIEPDKAAYYREKAGKYEEALERKRP